LRRFSSGAALNTDDHPVVLFGAPRFNARGDAAPYGRLMRLLASCTSHPGDLFHLDSPSASEYAEQLADFIRARDVYLSGLAAEAEGQIAKALDAYMESARISQRFSTGYARALTLAMQQSKSNPDAARAILRRLTEAQPNRPVARQLLQRLLQSSSLPANPQADSP
jgi:spermidine synthase